MPQAAAAARFSLALAPAVLVLMIAAAWLASPAGKGFAVLLAIVGYPRLEQLAHRYVRSALTATWPFEIGIQVVAVLLIAVLVTRARRSPGRRAGPRRRCPGLRSGAAPASLVVTRSARRSRR